jgi:two-component system NtrC family sensor kinase
LPEANPPRVALEISDSGPGVPPQHISRLFDPFFTTKPVGLGTGLGLSIAYGIVHDHGGDIYLMNSARISPGAPSLGGASFVVELPVLSAVEAVVQPCETEEAASVEPPREAEPVRVEKKHSASRVRARRGSILVVEDEPTVAQLVADVLKDEGYDVDVVLDSREGLARVARFGYDLIICDLRMPRIDGRAFYRSLVRSGHPAQLRLLFITGDTLSPRTLEFLDRTGLPCLAKPFLVEELKSIVAHTLDLLRKPRNGSAPKRRVTDFEDPAAMAPHSGEVPPSLDRRAEELRKQ